MVNFSLLAAEIGPVVWGTTANINGFRVLTALLHGSHVVGVSQTLRVEQRAPPMFGMAKVTLLIIPHSIVHIALTVRTKSPNYFRYVRDLQHFTPVLRG